MTTMNAAMAALFVVSVPAVGLADEVDEPDTGLVALYERVRPAVVRVHTREGAGSGFLIAPDRIATAWHVVDVRHDLRIETLDGRLIEATVLTRHKKHDLAVLQIDEPLTFDGEPVTPLSFAAETPPVGTPVAALGHPLSPSEDRKKGQTVGLLNWSLTEGIVSQVGDVSVHVTAAVECGSSGGPLLDHEGNVVGVVTLGIGSLGAATRVELLDGVVAAEPSLPKGPSVELHGRYGIGVTRLPGQDAKTGTFVTLSTGLEVVLDRKLMIGLAVDLDLLASKKARKEDNLRSRRLQMAAQIGPRFELPFRPKANVPMAIQPYFTAGVGMARTGVHQSTLRFTDPNCDPFTQDCAYDATSETVWNPNRWMPVVGGGLRVDIAGSWLGVEVTTNPGAPEQDTRVMFGMGVRF